MKSAWDQIEWLVQDALAVPGDVAEAGVYQGVVFAPLAELAAAHDRTAHAIDSFCGMARPSERDAQADGRQQYPEGAMSAHGSLWLRQKLHGVLGTVRIWEGYIPAVLARIPAAVRLAFIHIDLDHYRPTMATLKWAWERMAPRGIMCCHDWFPGKKILASAAIADWMALASTSPTGESETTHIWFSKGD